MQVIPTILSADKREVDKWLMNLRNEGKWERVQIDFIDGEYANNLTINPADVDLLPYLPLLFDAHLMVTQNNAYKWVNLAKKVGFDRIAIQAESISEPGNYEGLGLDIHSPVEVLMPYLGNVELVILMSVEPGFYGQKYDDRVVEKARALDKLRKYQNYQFRICVDGGVEKEHLPALAEAGVDEVTVGIRRIMDWG